MYQNSVLRLETGHLIFNFGNDNVGTLSLISIKTIAYFRICMSCCVGWFCCILLKGGTNEMLRLKHKFV